MNRSWQDIISPSGGPTFFLFWTTHNQETEQRKDCSLNISNEMRNLQSMFTPDCLNKSLKVYWGFFLGKEVAFAIAFLGLRECD